MPLTAKKIEIIKDMKKSLEQIIKSSQNCLKGLNKSIDTWETQQGEQNGIN